jgi:hypothetical protein
MEGKIMKTERFAKNGSPLAGRVVPPDWRDLDPQGKRARCVALGWAGDLYEAGRLLAKHAAAAVQGRKRKAERVRRISRTCWWEA